MLREMGKWREKGKVKVKVNVWVYRLDQVKTSLPTSQLPSLIIGTLTIELFGLWHSQGSTFS